MLDRIFLQVLEMSATASIVILVVLLVRLPLKRSPKIYSYLLWLVVLFRLLCPAALGVPWGGVPPVEVTAYPTESETLSLVGAAGTALHAVGDALNGGLGVQYAQTKSGDLITFLWWDTWWLIIKSILEYLWLAGIFVLLRYSVRSLRKLRGRLVGAVPLEGNVWLADHIDTAFVMGLFRPKIYLPSGLPEEKREFILRHEKQHIKRKDHLVKLLAFAALCLHWFNPLVWLAFFLLNRDMEMSCDEAVMKGWGGEARAEYSGLLLELATGRNFIAGAPLAFGEGDTGSRIKNLLKHRELKRWQAAALLFLVAGLGFFLSLDQLTEKRQLLGTRYAVEEILYEASYYSFSYTEETVPYYTITSDYSLVETHRGDGGSSTMPLRSMAYSRQELYGFFTELKNNVHERLDRVETVWRAEREHGGFYLVMRTRKGEVLLAVSTHEKVRWLFELEPIMTTPGDRDYIEQSIEGWLGGADAEVFAISGIGTDDADEEYTVIGFYSDGESEKSDVGCAVIRRVGWTYQMIDCHVYPDAGQNAGQLAITVEPVVLREDESIEATSENTYDVILLDDPSISMITQVIKTGYGRIQREVEYPTYGEPVVILLNWAESDGAGNSYKIYLHREDGVTFYDEVSR